MAEEPEQALLLPPEVGEAERSRWSAIGVLRDRLARFDESAPGRFWNHLSAADFMNSSFAFAALAVLSAFPFLAVTSAAIGGDFRKAIVAWGDESVIRERVKAHLDAGADHVCIQVVAEGLDLPLAGYGELAAALFAA